MARGNTPLRFRLPAERRGRLRRIARTFGYKTVTAYVVARLFFPLGMVGMAALRRVLLDVVRIEQRALDGHDVTSQIVMLRQRLETYLTAGTDELFSPDDTDEAA